MALISLVEYAKRLGKNRHVVYQKYQRGGFKTAQKIGRDILIDEDEPYIDFRVTSGKYRDWRRKPSASEQSDGDLDEVKE